MRLRSATSMVRTPGQSPIAARAVPESRQSSPSSSPPRPSTRRSASPHPPSTSAPSAHAPRSPRAPRPAASQHRHRHRHQPGDELLAIARVAALARSPSHSARSLRRPSVIVLRRHARQRDLLDQRVALLLRHLRQKQLAARRAMQRHVRAHVERQPQRPLRLDAIEVKHLRAVERREVAGLADLPHQLGQHLVPQPAHHAVVQRVEGQLPQRRARR